MQKPMSHLVLYTLFGALHHLTTACTVREQCSNYKLYCGKNVVPETVQEFGKNSQENREGTSFSH